MNRRDFIRASVALTVAAPVVALAAPKIVEPAPAYSVTYTLTAYQAELYARQLRQIEKSMRFMERYSGGPDTFKNLARYVK